MTVYPKYVTASTAAEILGVKVDTVRKWAKTGRITHVLTPGKRYRFEAAVLLGLMTDGPTRPAEVAPAPVVEPPKRESPPAPTFPPVIMAIAELLMRQPVATQEAMLAMLRASAAVQGMTAPSVREPDTTAATTPPPVETPVVAARQTVTRRPQPAPVPTPAPVRPKMDPAALRSQIEALASGNMA